MTRRNLRWLIAAFVVTYVWFWSMPSGVYKQPDYVRVAMEHSGRGSTIPPSDTTAYLFLIAILASAIGMFFFYKWGWWLLAITTLASVALSPLMGVIVTGPYDGTVGFLSALLNGALLVAAMRPPVVVAHEETVAVFETTNADDAKAVQMVLQDAGIEATTRVVVRHEEAIVAKDVLELGN